MKLGAAKQQAPSAWQLAKVEIAESEPEPSFTFWLHKKKLRQVRQREGRYLLRSNLTEQPPAQLWHLYIQLTQVEEAFKNLKGDLALRPLFHQKEARIASSNSRSTVMSKSMTSIGRVSYGLPGGLPTRFRHLVALSCQDGIVLSTLAIVRPSCFVGVRFEESSG